MPCNLSLLSVAQDSVTAPLNPHRNCVLLCAGQSDGERSATRDDDTQTC